MDSTTHNASAQKHVALNNDPALDIAQEHKHGHLHHDAHATADRDDELTYSKGTTFERSTIPDQDPMDHNLHRRGHPEKETKVDYSIADAEKGEISSDPERFKGHQEEDPRSHKLSNFYTKVLFADRGHAASY